MKSTIKTLPPAAAGRPTPLRAVEVKSPRSRYSRWRAGTLILVYVLMVVHVVHWRIAGKTLAPLELNEVMYTAELGIVTAGFIFMVVAMLATLIFGRFFCSWGCHILALQDLCSWLLGKVGIRPKAIRSRALLWVPVLAAGYMFAWPQITRLAEGRPLPTAHLRTDAEGWASFATDNFWRNLPGPGIIILTFAIVGFLIVYVFGSRSFCAYGCPYGALFGLLDRFTPGRIRAKPGRTCENCGICTAACGSHVRVHEEMERYGMIVNPACLKDLDCVSVCPDQSMHYAFGQPSIMKRVRSDTVVQKSYDFSLWEEGILALAFLVCLFVYRALYDQIPFLLALGWSAIAAYLLVVALRMFRSPAVAVNRLKLKAFGKIKRIGWGYLGLMALFCIFTVHSAYVRYHTFQARRFYQLAQISPLPADDAAGRAIHHFSAAASWGLLSMDHSDYLLADLYGRQQRWSDVEITLRRLVERDPNQAQAHLALGEVLAAAGRQNEAIESYRTALRLDSNRADTHYRLAGALFATRQPAEALQHLREALKLRPDFVAAHYDLGALLVESGDPVGGMEHLRRAIALEPNHADAHYNLAVALSMTGQYEEAIREIDLAQSLNPGDEQTQQFRRHLVSAASSVHNDSSRTTAPRP